MFKPAFGNFQVELDDKTLPRKKRKLEKKMTSSNKDSSVKVE